MIHTNSLPDLNPLLGQTNKNPRIGHDMQVGGKGHGCSWARSSND